MSALKPSERSEVSVFNKARVLGVFPLFFFYCVLCCMFEIVDRNDPLLFRYGDVLIFTHKDSCKIQKLSNSLSRVPMKNVLHIFREATIVLLSCLIHRDNTKVEFGVFCGPPPRETHRPWAPAANGILFRTPTKLFSPSSILQEELPDT